MLNLRLADPPSVDRRAPGLERPRCGSWEACPLSAEFGASQRSAFPQRQSGARSGQDAWDKRFAGIRKIFPDFSFAGLDKGRSCRVNARDHGQLLKAGGSAAFRRALKAKG